MSNVITEKNFQTEVLENKLPVLLDFWAEWCGPCRMLSPIVDEISKELADKLFVAKVNIDENPNIASQYGILSIPTLLVFKDGKILDSKVGALSKAKIKDWLETLQLGF
ncbi:MAG: thioredoxin [Rickettsiaceae bacterium]|nr:thioredoxin [Rickettsiaceae bacterium]